MNKSSLAALVLATLACSASLSAQETRPEGRPPEGERGERGERGPQQPRRDPIVVALDANSDGVIDAAELADATANLKKLDKNGDGQLTLDEIRPPRRQRGQEGGNPQDMVNRLLQLDKDGDGKLSAEELPERMRGMLDRADLNKDGFLDKDELLKQAQAQAAARGNRGEGEGERREHD